MKRNYELNLVIDTNFSSAEIAETIKNCQKIVGDSHIMKIDDIGLLPTAYPIRGQYQAYYLSYFIELDPQLISGIKSDLRITKGLAKFFVYSCANSDDFVTFSDMQKKYLEFFPVEEEIGSEDETIEEISDKVDGE